MADATNNIHLGANGGLIGVAGHSAVQHRNDVSSLSAAEASTGGRSPSTIPYASAASPVPTQPATIATATSTLPTLLRPSSSFGTAPMTDVAAGAGASNSPPAGRGHSLSPGAVTPAITSGVILSPKAQRTTLSTSVVPRRKRKTSGVWQCFERFQPIVAGARNVRCTVPVETPANPALGLPARTVRCGATYTHVEARNGHGGSGTSGMLHHLASKHPEVHAAVIDMGARASKARRVDIAGATQATKAKAHTPKRKVTSSPTETPPPKAHPPHEASIVSTPATPSTLKTSGVDRSFVLMCALNTLDPHAFASSLGFRFYAGSPTQASVSLAEIDKVLRDLSAALKAKVSHALFAQHESCRRLGWRGAFVGLQVDVTSGHDFEFSTAYISFVPEDFGEVVRLAVGARWFRGKIDAQSADAWIRELTKDLFAGLCGELEPKDVYLTATIGGTGAAPLNFIDAMQQALRGLGVPVIVCTSSRLHFAALSSLGCGNGAEPKDRASPSEEEGRERELLKNSLMQDVFARLGVMLEALGGSKGTGATDVAVEASRSKLDELVVALERSRLPGARWTEQHALLDRILDLKEPLEARFEATPNERSFLPSGWQAVREAASVLDPALEVLAKVDSRHEASNGDEGGGGGVFLAETVNLYANLHQSFVFPTQDIRFTGDHNGPVVSEQVQNLTPEVQQQLVVLAKSMDESGLGRAREPAEFMSIILDPRFKSSCESTCVNGGSALRLRALTAVTDELRNFDGPTAEAEESSTAGNRDPSAADAGSNASNQQGGPVAKLSRLEKMRQAQGAALGRADGGSANEQALAAAARAVAGESKRTEDALRELEEYMVESAGKRRGLLAYWKLHGTETVDSGTGKVVLPSRWPHLGLLARLYAGVEVTSRPREVCPGQSGCGGDIVLAVTAMRTTLPPRKVEQMVLLRLNKHLVPEIASFGRTATG